VEAIGGGVTNVGPGDYVVLAWRAPCGTCRSCARGRPWYCFDSANAAQRMTLPDGTPLSPALGIGAFAEKTLVAAGQAVKVDRAAPGRGGALKPSWYGDCLPSRDFPMLIDLFLSGRFPLDRFVSETIALDQVDAAFVKMQRGEVLRSVVVF